MELSHASGSRGVPAVATLGILAALLAGCAIPRGDDGGSSANQPTGNDLTLEVAKEHAIEVRDEIAVLYPPEDISELRANATSRALMPCGGEERFAWPGRTTITVAGSVDKEDALASIAAEWADRDGWTVETRTSSNGLPRIVLNHLDGTHVNIAYFYGGDELWIDVVSPCFALPGGLGLGGEY